MEFEKIIKERRIPTKGQLLVKLESLVEPTTVIAKGTVPSMEIEELKLDQSLNVKPEYVKNHLINVPNNTIS